MQVSGATYGTASLTKQSLTEPFKSISIFEYCSVSHDLLRKKKKKGQMERESPDSNFLLSQNHPEGKQINRSETETYS